MTKALSALLAVLVVFSSPVTLRAAVDPGDRYLQFYFQVGEAEKQESAGNITEALQRYEAANALLDSIRRDSPTWKPEIVAYRSKYCRDKVAALRSLNRSAAPPSSRPNPPTGLPPASTMPSDPLPQHLPPQAATQRKSPPQPVAPVAPVEPVAPASAASSPDLRSRMTQLERELSAAKRELNNTRASLEAARKELGKGAAGADNAQKVVRLQQERDQLQSRLDQMQRELAATQTQAVDQRVSELLDKLTTAQNQLKEARSAVAVRDEQIQKLAQQRLDLQEKLQGTQKDLDILRKGGSVPGGANAAAIEAELRKTQAERDDLQNKLEETQKEMAMLKAGAVDKRVAQLLAENSILNEKLKRAEETLSKVRSSGGGAQTSASDITGLREQLASARDQIRKIEAENMEYERSAADLKAKLTEAEASLSQARKDISQSSSQGGLQEENEMLRSIVSRQQKEQARRESTKRLAFDELKKLKIQSEVLENQIELLGAPVVELSDDEKRLLKLGDVRQQAAPAPAEIPAIQDTPTISAPLPEQQPETETVTQPQKSSAASGSSDLTSAVPALAVPLAREAQDYFTRRDFERAATKYEEILKSYPDNLHALSNLGVVRFQQGKFPEAEQVLLKAIKVDPNDGFSHSILGIVHYKLGRYEEAVTALRKSALLLPNDASTRNYLGIACMQKGWQSIAEEELRKAIEIDPTYGDAHFNLSVVYATQKPPAKEMARRHYKRAQELGVPADPDLERMLE